MINSETGAGSGRKLFYGLFIFPLLIAVGMAVLLCTVVLLTRESETPESLITAIKTGPPSKRWQKAFELSNEINQGRGLIRQSGVMKEIIHVMNDREHYDAKTRAYMGMALARFKEPEAAAALRAALAKEEDAGVQLHLIWALGLANAREAAPDVAGYLEREDADLRKTAAYVLGALGDRSMAPALERRLEDSERDVRWNAALSLARLGSGEGYDELLKMLDREALVAQYALDDAKIESIMVNAVKGLSLVGRPDSWPLLAEISNSDKSLKVREAAIQALQKKEAPVLVPDADNSGKSF